MKRFLVVLFAMTFFVLPAYATEGGVPEEQPTMPPGVRASMLTVGGIVERVHAIDYKGARFRAYQVRWNDFDVIVSDPLGTTDLLEGDPITFMVNITELKEQKIKVLSFMVMDFRAFQK